MTVVLCIKESYSKGKKVNIFTFAYGQGQAGGSEGVDPPPHLPYGQPDRKIPVFYGFPSGCLLYYVLANNKRETKRAC